MSACHDENNAVASDTLSKDGECQPEVMESPNTSSFEFPPQSDECEGSQCKGCSKVYPHKKGLLKHICHGACRAAYGDDEYETIKQECKLDCRRRFLEKSKVSSRAKRKTTTETTKEVRASGRGRKKCNNGDQVELSETKVMDKDEERKMKQKMRYYENQEEIKLRQRNYYHRHKEEKKLKQQEYYNRNREERILKQRKYYLEHREASKQRQRQYYQKHRDERKLKQRQYYHSRKHLLKQEFLVNPNSKQEKWVRNNKVNCAHDPSQTCAHCQSNILVLGGLYANGLQAVHDQLMGDVQRKFAHKESDSTVYVKLSGQFIRFSQEDTYIALSYTLCEDKKDVLSDKEDQLIAMLQTELSDKAMQSGLGEILDEITKMFAAPALEINKKMIFIKVVFGGNYEFLKAITDMSGPDSNFPCIFCLMEADHVYDSSKPRNFYSGERYVRAIGQTRSYYSVKDQDDATPTLPATDANHVVDYILFDESALLQVVTEVLLVKILYTLEREQQRQQQTLPKKRGRKRKFTDDSSFVEHLVEAATKCGLPTLNAWKDASTNVFHVSSLKNSSIKLLLKQMPRFLPGLLPDDSAEKVVSLWKMLQDLQALFLVESPTMHMPGGFHKLAKQWSRLFVECYGTDEQLLDLHLLTYHVPFFLNKYRAPVERVPSDEEEEEDEEDCVENSKEMGEGMFLVSTPDGSHLVYNRGSKDNDMEDNGDDSISHGSLIEEDNDEEDNEEDNRNDNEEDNRYDNEENRNDNEEDNRNDNEEDNRNDNEEDNRNENEKDNSHENSSLKEEDDVDKEDSEDENMSHGSVSEKEDNDSDEEDSGEENISRESASEKEDKDSEKEEDNLSDDTDSYANESVSVSGE